MTARTFLFCLMLAVLLGSPLRAADESDSAPAPTPKPGLISRMLHVFHKSPASTDKKETVNTKKMALELVVAPIPVKLSENRQMTVTLKVANHSKKLIHLEFPTSQRIEVLIRNQAGKQLTQWSEDQSFENTPSYVAINPGERVEYSVSVATRDMSAGESYTVEAFLPNYQEIRATQVITPLK